MTGPGWGAALRQLRVLFGSGTTAGLGDGVLLSRYAETGDAAAFEAMVARHGPMVAATCRAVLRREHDAEDAFQATFLILARKAGSIRVGDTLGGWLHRVAYRVAVEAGAEAKRRRRVEAEAAAMATPDASFPGPEPDVGPILHQEIDRLPAGYRLPVVLCDLEGVSYEEAAARLQWTLPTLRTRLARGRRRLKDRLIRRGLGAAVAGVALAPRAAMAIVPASWVRAVVSAATGGTASTGAIALTHTILKGMLMTKLKIAATAALATVVMGSAGVIAVGAGRSDEPEAAPPKAPVVAEEAAPQPDSRPGEVKEVRGRVVDPDGRPVAGATVRLAFYGPEDRRIPEATSGPDGRFLLRASRSIEGSVALNGYEEFPWVVATAPGFGLGRSKGAFTPPDEGEGERTVHLVAEGPPIEGRVVDLEGRPVAGARVEVNRVMTAPDRDLSSWIKQAEDKGMRNMGEGLDDVPLSVPIVAEAGPDGRFRVAGLGRDWVVHLVVSGPTIATDALYAMTRDGPEVRIPDRRNRMPSGTFFLLYARHFVHVAALTKPIVGVVRDKDSGAPLAGLEIKAAVFEEHRLIPAEGIEATTDAEGHYRLTGLPLVPTYRLFVEPGAGQPYPRANFKVPVDTPALEPLTFDVALKRGVLLRGRVTDKATGWPAIGYINAFVFRDNPYLKEFTESADYDLTDAPIKEDGRYELAVLPGRNLIGCRSEMRRYRGRVGADAIKDRVPEGVYEPRSKVFFAFPRDCYVRNYHLLAEIDVDPKADSATLDLQLDPGRTLTINITDPDGRPLAGTVSTGTTDLFSSSVSYRQETPEVEVHGLDPSSPRRVTVVHADRKLIGSLYLKGDEAGPLTLRLQPWGTITGRIVDGNGRPRGGLALGSIGGSYPKRPDEQGVLPDGDYSGGIRLGHDGRFRVDRLIPGLKYGADAHDRDTYGVVFRDVTVNPGEDKDLGDLKVIPAEVVPKP